MLQSVPKCDSPVHHHTSAGFTIPEFQCLSPLVRGTVIRNKRPSNIKRDCRMANISETDKTPQSRPSRVLSLDYRNEERRAASIVLVVPHYALMDLSEQKMHVRQAAWTRSALSVMRARSPTIQFQRVWKRTEGEVATQEIDHERKTTGRKPEKQKVLSQMRLHEHQFSCFLPSLHLEMPWLWLWRNPPLLRIRGFSLWWVLL